VTGHRLPHLAEPDDADATNDAGAHVPTFPRLLQFDAL
jgi:hypothetical protein